MMIHETHHQLQNRVVTRRTHVVPIQLTIGNTIGNSKGISQPGRSRQGVARGRQICESMWTYLPSKQPSRDLPSRKTFPYCSLPGARAPHSYRPRHPRHRQLGTPLCFTTGIPKSTAVVFAAFFNRRRQRSSPCVDNESHRSRRR